MKYNNKRIYNDNHPMAMLISLLTDILFLRYIFLELKYVMEWQLYNN